MSGHSKWATIKHKKGAAGRQARQDFHADHQGADRRGARTAAAIPDMNPRLRTIIADAKQVNMPADNIKRAIHRGTGEEGGRLVRRDHLRGHGPGGVAILVEALTDNRNRTVGEIRHTFGKRGGKLGDPNSVARMFTKRSQIVVEKSKAQEEADERRPRSRRRRHDRRRRGVVDRLGARRAHAGARGRQGARHRAGVGRDRDAAEEYIKLEGKQAQQMLKLMDALEENEDMKNVWSNFDVDEKEIEASLA